jgi:hypothetical protein
MTKDPELTRLMNPEFPGGMDYLHDLSAEELQAILVRLESEHDARDSLLRYGYVMYGERFAAARHHRLIAKYLERIERGDIDRLIISMPPRSGKPVAEDELILMADGSRKPLREIVVGDYVITHRRRACMVSAVHEQGTIPVVSVRTRHGLHRRYDEIFRFNLVARRLDDSDVDVRHGGTCRLFGLLGEFVAVDHEESSAEVDGAGECE